RVPPLFDRDDRLPRDANAASKFGLGHFVVGEAQGFDTVRDFRGFCHSLTPHRYAATFAIEPTIAERKNPRMSTLPIQNQSHSNIAMSMAARPAMITKLTPVRSPSRSMLRS